MGASVVPGDIASPVTMHRVGGMDIWLNWKVFATLFDGEILTSPLGGRPPRTETSKSTEAEEKKKRENRTAWLSTRWKMKNRPADPLHSEVATPGPKISTRRSKRIAYYQERRQRWPAAYARELTSAPERRFKKGSTAYLQAHVTGKRDAEDFLRNRSASDISKKGRSEASCRPFVKPAGVYRPPLLGPPYRTLA